MSGVRMLPPNRLGENTTTHSNKSVISPITSRPPVTHFGNKWRLPYTGMGMKCTSSNHWIECTLDALILVTVTEMRLQHHLASDLDKTGLLASFLDLVERETFWPPTFIIVVEQWNDEPDEPIQERMFVVLTRVISVD